MNTIFLIIQREYLTRVRKKSFIIMTLLGPLLMASAFIVPVLISNTTDDAYSIQVVDEAGFEFKDTKKLTFERSNLDVNEAKKAFVASDYYALLYVPKSVMTDAKGVELLARKDVSLTVKERIGSIIETQLYSSRLASKGIDRAILDSLKADVSIKTIKATENGEEKSSSEASTIVGFIAGFLIYFFIFLYGMQVMRGVMEEKTNRIVEVIISSVKPFQLMMGKIVGIAMVGLTQFLLWVVLTISITAGVTSVFMKGKSGEEKAKFAMEQRMGSYNAAQLEHMTEDQSPSEGMEIMEALTNLNLVYIIGVFIFYFLGGYLLYSALFAAVGAAVDQDSDTQQFIMPITIPLILSFIIAQSVVTTNPDSNIALWFSLIPLTSPIVMMVRIPFGVPGWQLALSMLFLVLGFIGTTWIAARIYRTGILLYGKKVTYKELAKWLFYKG